MHAHLKKMAWVSALVVAGAVAFMLFCFNPAVVPIYPLCLFHRLTGLNCPGCGSLRALHQLSHGHLVAALRLNALLVLSLPLWGWLGFCWIKQQAQGAPLTAVRPLWLWLYLGAWIAFGIVRDLPIPLYAALGLPR